jgi:hypothetical protein
MPKSAALEASEAQGTMGRRTDPTLHSASDIQQVRYFRELENNLSTLLTRLMLYS